MESICVHSVFYHFTSDEFVLDKEVAAQAKGINASLFNEIKTKKINVIAETQEEDITTEAIEGVRL